MEVLNGTSVEGGRTFEVDFPEGRTHAFVAGNLVSRVFFSQQPTPCHQSSVKSLESLFTATPTRRIIAKHEHPARGELLHPPQECTRFPPRKPDMSTLPGA